LINSAIPECYELFYPQFTLPLPTNTKIDRFTSRVGDRYLVADFDIDQTEAAE